MRLVWCVPGVPDDFSRYTEADRYCKSQGLSPRQIYFDYRY